MPKAKKPSEVTSTSAGTTPATGVSAGPQVIPTNVSTPPDGWVDPQRIGRKGRRPRNGLPLVAEGLSAELRKNAPAIVQELGPKAVDPAQVASALDDAHAWDGVEAKASTFHTYARAKRSAAWDHAVTLMAGMKLGVRYAVSRDASFADRFPGVAKAFAPVRHSSTTAASPANGPSGATPTTKRSRKKATAVAVEPATAPAPTPAGTPQAPTGTPVA
jgi:hypothetical protein